MPIEVKSRELMAALILAYTAARKGFRVYVGSHASITTALLTKPYLGGIYFDKSTQPKSLFDFVKAKCEYICVLDYEISPSVSVEILKKLIPQRIYDYASEFVDRFYVCGKESELVANSIFSSEKVKDMGWPKWDLYRPPSRDTLFRNIKLANKEQCPYLVFASSYRYLIPPKKMLNFRKPGLIQPNERVTLEYKENHYKNFLIAVEELLKFDKDPDFPFVFVKPHHNESSREWRRALKGCQKTIVVSHRDSLDALIYHSNGLIHAGTTAAIHAWLMNKPLYFLTKASIKSRHLVTFQLSKFLLFANSDSAHRKGGVATVEENPEYSEQILNTFLTLRQPSNSLNLTEDLLGLNTVPSHRVSRFGFHRQQLSLRSARRALGLIRDELLWLLRKTNMGSQFHYLGTGIRKQEIKYFLSKFSFMLDGQTKEKVKLRQIGLNLIEIELKGVN